MDFEIPADLRAYLGELDAFIEREVKPLEREHPEYLDHRREFARTDWEHGGIPRREWEELLGEVRRRADAAGHLRFALPRELGGRDGSNLAMAIIRDHRPGAGSGPQRPPERALDRRQLPTVIMMWRSAPPRRRRSSCPA
jgi:alkylation response protein AidB-like acyl-CoA dehydrogenase